MVKISVVIATYNAEKHLPGALAAYASQTYSNKELLISDGGSIDTTPSLIDAHRDIITWSQSSKDKGIFDAWNKAIQRATGDWIYFMGADDRFVDVDTLANAAERLSALQKHDLVAYGLVNLIDTKGERAETIGRPWNAKRFRSEGMTIPHQGVFTRKEYFETYGLFDTNLRYTATYEFYMRHLRDSDAVFMSGLLVGNMGVGGVSTLPQNQLRFMNSYISAQIKHRTFKPTVMLTFYYLQAVTKYLLFAIMPKSAALNIIEGVRRAAGKKAHFR